MEVERNGFFYVYALKDPRLTPARPFYVGKGIGPRAEQHLSESGSPKAARIAEIRKSGRQPIVEILVSGLSESAALKIEAELIAAFGTEASGGTLTNQVVPTGRSSRPGQAVVLPSGALEKAQVGLSLLRAAVLDTVRANPEGLSNGEVTNSLGLQSDYRGGSINYLAYSILGILLREGTIVRTGKGSGAKHRAAQDSAGAS